MSVPSHVKPAMAFPEVDSTFNKVREEKKVDRIDLDHSLVIPRKSNASESSSE
jgi:hypothetical protein